jgi:hypothetical protein
VELPEERASIFDKGTCGFWSLAGVVMTEHTGMDNPGSDNPRLDHAVMKSVAEQIMSGDQVVVGGRTFRVSRTGKGRFRTVRFLLGGREYQAIEQNPEKPSRWGKLAREGHRVVQFRDLQLQKYVGVAVDGEVHEYRR